MNLHPHQPRENALRYLLTTALIVALGPAAALAGSAPAPVPAPRAADEPSSGIGEVLDAVVAREHELGRTLERYQPLVETYLQTVRPDPTLGTVPVSDKYFLGRVVLSEGPTDAKNGRSERRRKPKDQVVSLASDFYSETFRAGGFVQVMVLDREGLDRQNYDFTFVRREFLGDVRTLVFEVQPKPTTARKVGRFTGRIWVEDRDYSIVRYNGIYSSTLDNGVRFDSWRLSMGPGRWFPAYVYTESTEKTLKKASVTHKSQTRIWGYDVERESAEDEFTKVVIEAPEARDRSESPGEISPVESARAWEREAEENVVQRLARSGLLAADGDVDQVLQTVVGNLEVTNDLHVDPPVRCRVLLTTPLESFTVGHTIVLSRGLIDVLPDEASLAMVLAHELGHILAGHRLDTRYAFSDQVLLGDAEAMQQFAFQRFAEEEQEADERAVHLLENSPYKDQLAGAGLFLRALAARAETLPSLIRAHFGNRMAAKEQIVRMPKIVAASPQLDPAALEQIAALPLGSRIKVDPWDASIELMKNNRVALLSAREKMPFLVTPLMPHLARHEDAPPGEHDRAAEPDARPPSTAQSR